MGLPKAEIVVDGTRLLDRAVAALRRGGCDPVLAVVREGTTLAGAQAVVNVDPARGMRSSIELAVAAAGDCDALAVLLVDLPGVDADAVAAVVAGWNPGRIAVARYGTRRGHPTVMAPDLWREALVLAGPDEGARALLSTRPDLVDEVAVTGDGSTDLDTPADLAAWQRTGARRISPSRGNPA
jgi:molybdenum cofactor cytidylyltransferase/nicotine blue oxidoreductase